jgi:hypothetical protein
MHRALVPLYIPLKGIVAEMILGNDPGYIDLSVFSLVFWNRSNRLKN